MTELMQKAIDKIDKEAEAINSPAITIVASHIIDVYIKSDENAQKVLDKTLKDCWNKVSSQAKKETSNSCAVISNDTVYEWVKEYYGFAEATAGSEKIVDIFDYI